jgi:hypothetical protein
MSAPITRAELLDFLQEQLPTVPVPELGKLATGLALILKAGHIAVQPKPARKMARYRDKPVAQSLKLKS